MRTTLLMLLLAMVLPVPADAVVYTLRDGAGSADVESVLSGKATLEDRVLVNGVRGTLQVRTLKSPLAELRRQLAAYVEDLAVEGTESALLLEGKAAGGRRLRYYLMSIGPEYRTVVFRMELPAEAAGRPDEAWPETLPRPGGASIQQVIALPARDCCLGSFASPAPPRALRQEYDRELLRAGWKPLGDSRSGVYTRSRRMLVFVAGPGRGRGSVGTVYTKRLDAQAGLF